MSSPITFDELMELRGLCEKNYSRDVDWWTWAFPQPGSIDYEVTNLCQRRLVETRDAVEQLPMVDTATDAERPGDQQTNLVGRMRHNGGMDRDGG